MSGKDAHAHAHTLTHTLSLSLSISFSLSTQSQDILGPTQQHIDAFARAGLRTLTFAYRDLDEEFVTAWTQEHNRALMVRDVCVHACVRVCVCACTCASACDWSKLPKFMFSHIQ
jgi:hypothetical protein